MALDRLAMQARALVLDGALELAADGLPQAFALTGRIGTPDFSARRAAPSATFG